MPPISQLRAPRDAPRGTWLPQYTIGRKKTKTADISAACLDSLDFIGCLRIGKWWAQQDSNLRLPPCEGGTLPLSYAPGTALEATQYTSSIHGVKLRY